MVLADNKGFVMAMPLVLSIGLDVELLITRNLVLQYAGFTVVPAFSIEEAVACFLDRDFDLVLLCQTVPTHLKERLTCWIRATGSSVPVVTVSGWLCQHDAFANATVEGNPITLLMGIRETLAKAAIRAQ